MEPTRVLPEGYREAGSLDLSASRWLAIIFNVLGFFLFLVSGALFLLVLAWLRPEAARMGLSLQFSSVGQLLLSLLVIVLVVAGAVVLHEAVHGLFFWLFTRSRPVFRLRLLYASAGAPEWYLPCRQHMVVGVAPLVVITVLGIIVLAVAPFGLLYPTIFVLAQNAGGSIGDLIAAAWLLTQPKTCLANDQGNKITLYRPRT
ncbi:MAG: DUF3267 domain-containing protein [Anaerolineae bacterium]|jgi:hypothetical protein